MILVNELIHDKEYWFCKLITSKRGDRIRERFKPSKVKFTLLKEPVSYSYYGSTKIGSIRDLSKGYEVMSVFESATKIDALFDNEEDCIKYYNDLVCGYLDFLDSQHAKERARIEKEFIKKKGK